MVKDYDTTGLEWRILVARPREYSPRGHGDTEKNKAKAKPERTEAAEATEEERLGVAAGGLQPGLGRVSNRGNVYGEIGDADGSIHRQSAEARSF